jgi:preprotein translocase subunit YajC
MQTLAFLLQATTAAKQPSPYSSLIFFAAIIVIFYFFMIRPQMKKQKELKNYRDALKKGDKVVTAGGIYGRIFEVNERTVLLEIDQNVKIKVDKGSIVRTAEDITAEPSK